MTSAADAAPSRETRRTENLERRHQHAAYGALTAGFALGLGALLLSARRTPAGYASDDPASRPEADGARGIPWSDLVLMGIATHKVARLVATDRVTQPVRAPFTEPETGYREPTGGALRHSLGELVTCPYCVAPWITLAVGTAYVHQPALTRLGASLFTIVGISDFLNRCYSRLSD